MLFALNSTSSSGSSRAAPICRYSPAPHPDQIYLCVCVLLLPSPVYEREQLDPVLKGLDADVATAGSEEDVEALKAQIKGRENALLPMYLQVCMRF